MMVGEVIAARSTDGPASLWRVTAVDETSCTLRRYSTARWIIPLTGWWSDYRYIARRKDIE